MYSAQQGGQREWGLGKETGHAPHPHTCHSLPLVPHLSNGDDLLTPLIGTVVVKVLFQGMVI